MLYKIVFILLLNSYINSATAIDKVDEEKKSNPTPGTNFASAATTPMSADSQIVREALQNWREQNQHAEESHKQYSRLCCGRAHIRSCHHHGIDYWLASRTPIAVLNMVMICRNVQH